MNIKHNFSAGPAILPQPVYEEASLAIINYQKKGLSILEISHRSADFDSIIIEAEELLRELLSIPKEYSILFLAGGASQHFAQIPLNLLEKGDKASYLDSGLWASNAIEEAKLYGEINVVASGKENNYHSIPTHYNIPDDSKYFHYQTIPFMEQNYLLFPTLLYLLYVICRRIY